MDEFNRTLIPIALYHRARAPYDIVHAVQLTEDVFERCANIPNVDVVFRKEPKSLVFRDPALGREVAEMGDYIVSDMAGRFWPIDKEIFEATYDR